MALVALRDRDYEAQVRVDHPVLRSLVALLDQLRELDLLGGGEQWVAARLVEEELERVGGRRRELAVHVVGVFALAAAVVAQLDVARFELVEKRFGRIVIQLERLHERVHLRQLEAALFLPTREERFDLVFRGIRHSVGLFHLLSIPGSAPTQHPLVADGTAETLMIPPANPSREG